MIKRTILVALGSTMLTGCSSSATSATPTTPATTVSSLPTALSSVPGGTATAPAITAPAAAASCAAKYLQVKLGPSQGAAGSSYMPLTFTNGGPDTCSLTGYPGVSLAGGTPVTQIGLAANHSTAAPPTLVTLAPGAVANAVLQIVNAGNYSAADCGPVTATFLQVYPPNQTTPIYLAVDTPACSNPVPLLTVGVVQTGAGG